MAPPSAVSVLMRLHSYEVGRCHACGICLPGVFSRRLAGNHQDPQRLKGFAPLQEVFGRLWGDLVSAMEHGPALASKSACIR